MPSPAIEALTVGTLVYDQLVPERQRWGAILESDAAGVAVTWDATPAREWIARSEIPTRLGTATWGEMLGDLCP